MVVTPRIKVTPAIIREDNYEVYKLEEERYLEKDEFTKPCIVKSVALKKKVFMIVLSLDGKPYFVVEAWAREDDYDLNFYTAKYDMEKMKDVIRRAKRYYKDFDKVTEDDLVNVSIQSI